MQRFNMAGLIIEIIHNKPLSLHKFQPFIYLGTETPDITVEISGCKQIPIPQGEMVLNEGFKWVKDSKSNSNSSVYICKKEPRDIAYLLNVNSEWNKANIMYQEAEFDAEFAVMGPLSEIILRNRLLFNKGLVLHASAIQHKGRGILFSAPSETGKTTQANLWCKEMGAILINNDRPAVRVIGSEAYVYGTPWSGSIAECNNRYAPVATIVMLEQATENSISKLNTNEAILKLMPRCFLPYYDSQLMNIAMDNLESILKKVPIYLLKCRPDREAVELVYKTLWRNIE